MISPNISFIFFSLLISVSSYGITKKSTHRKSKLNFNINFLGEHFVDIKNTNSFEAELSLKYKHKFNKSLGLILSPHLDINKYKNSKNHSYLIRTENSGLYANYKNFSLTGGFLSHSFGVSQLFSPLNFVDTFSYWSPLNPKKISSPALRFIYTNKKIKFFASYLPKRFENIYPGNQTPWIPTQTPGTLVSEGDTYLLSKTKIIYTILEKKIIDNALTANFVSGLHLKANPFLVKFIYYKGVDTDPTVNLNLNLDTIDLTPGQKTFQIKNPIGVVPVYQRVERLGLSLRYTLPFKWRFLYEGNISKGDKNVRQEYLRKNQTHTIGLEWGVPIGKTLLLGVLQVYTSKSSNKSSLGFVSPFKEAYLFGINWKYKKYALRGGYFTSKSLMISLYTFKVSYEMSKSLRFNISGNLLVGELLELLSGLLDRDTISAQVQYHF